MSNRNVTIGNCTVRQISRFYLVYAIHHSLRPKILISVGLFTAKPLKWFPAFFQANIRKHYFSLPYTLNSIQRSESHSKHFLLALNEKVCALTRTSQYFSVNRIQFGSFEIWSVCLSNVYMPLDIFLTNVNVSVNVYPTHYNEVWPFKTKSCWNIFWILAQNVPINLNVSL
jgi:hypothetical protein